MTVVIDVDKYKKKTKIRFIIHLICLFLLIAGVVIGSVFSLIKSPLDYRLNLILNIAIDSLLICFLIFYFFNIFPVVVHYYRIFKNANHVAYEHRRHLTYIEEKNIKTISIIRFRTLSFSYKEGEGTYLDNLYVLDSDIELKKGQKYSLYTYRNIIIKLEEINNATIK